MRIEIWQPEPRIMGAFGRINSLIAIEHDWLLLLEPANQRQVLTRRQLRSCSTKRRQWRMQCFNFVYPRFMNMILTVKN